MKNNQRQLKAGIIGLGVGEKHIGGYNSHNSCEVTKICDFDQLKLEEVSKRHPGIKTTTIPEEIIYDKDIDVISIASFDNYHSNQIITSLDQNKHIFVEKPLCLTREEFNAIADKLLAKKDLCLSSNLILRKTPRFIELRNRIQRNKLGNHYLLEASYDYGRIHKIVNGWRGKIPFYSVMHGGGIHLIDLMLWITGDKILSVTSTSTKIVTKPTQFRHPDCVEALLKFESGAIGHVTSNFPSVIPHGHRLSIYAEKGSFHHGPLGCAYFWSRDPNSKPEHVNDSYPGSTKGDMIPSFLNYILDRNKYPESSVQEVLDSMAVSLSIEESLLTGKEVQVKYRIID